MIRRWILLSFMVLVLILTLAYVGENGHIQQSGTLHVVRSVEQKMVMCERSLDRIEVKLATLCKGLQL